MCGRYQSYTDAASNPLQQKINALEERMLANDSAVRLKCSGEVFPTDIVPVLIGDDRRLRLVAMRWGVPGYPAASGAAGRPLINAKLETVRERPTWREAVRLRRCVVPTAGFYEWAHGAHAERTKYLFSMTRAEPLYLAGIYAFHSFQEQMLAHFVILTGVANASVAGVHDRMPRVLSPVACHTWLWGDWESLLVAPTTALNQQPVMEKGEIT